MVTCNYAENTCQIHKLYVETKNQISIIIHNYLQSTDKILLQIHGNQVKDQT